MAVLVEERLDKRHQRTGLPVQDPVHGFRAQRVCIPSQTRRAETPSGA